MKKLLSLCLLLMTAIAGWAQTEFTVGNFKYTVTDAENHYVSIAKADEAELPSALVIPSSVTNAEVTYTVTSIAASAFYGAEITSVTIPSSVTRIDDEAFYYCSSLSSFSIPSSVTTIGERVFDNCSIPNFTFEVSNTPITCNSAIPCTNHLYLYRNVTKEGTLTNSIKALTIGPAVTTIYNSMFGDSSFLNSIDLSSATGLESIGDNAFYNCGNADSGEEPVPNLTTIDLSNTKVESIGADAFRECSKMETISLPNTLESIGDEAFYYCSSLSSFSVPSSVTTIGERVFDYCSIPNFTFEASNTAITCGSVIPCTNHLYLYRNVTKESTLTNSIKALTIGANVTDIGTMFSECYAITDVTVPWLSSPIAIGEGAFHETALANATLWIPGGTGDIYNAADGWKEFANKDFASFVVSITGSAHGTLAVADISSTNNETATTLIDRGEDAVFTVTPATGYELKTFTVNDVAATPTEGSYTVENLSADQTVVAGFTPITYTLTYTLDGGTATNPTTYTIETATFTLNNPTKAGYDFAGWKLNGVGEAMMTVTIDQGSTGHLAYTATWTPIIYHIEYTMDGGTATPANPTTYTIETATFTLTNPTKTGYDFAGWKLNGEGNAMMEVTITQGSTGHLAYTATWQVKQYTITFNSDGGSAVAPITLDYGSTVTAPEDPTRDGYDFAGWTPELPKTMPAENITVTATWTKKTYTVSITGGGVTADNYSPEDGDDVVLTIMDDPDATLTSLTVNGTEVKESIVNNQYTIVNVSGNVSVVATWSSTKEFVTLATPIATLSCEQDLNFTGSDLKAYIAAGYSKSENQVLLVRVYDVPANTGLVIRGEAEETYKIPYSTSQSYFVNLLKAHLTNEDVPATSGDYYNYVLKRVDGVYKWLRPKSGDTTMTLGAKKAYLQLPSSFMTAASREIGFAFEDDTTTDLSNFVIFTNGKSGDRIYNLNGQQVDNMGKGVYIVNGRKVMK